MGLLAPLSSGMFQRLIGWFGSKLRPWHCLGLANHLIKQLPDGADPFRFTSPRVLASDTK